MQAQWSAAALPPLSNAPEARSARYKSGGRAAALHLVLLLFALPLFAVPPTSAITGRVLSGGAPAAGVTITVVSPVMQGQRETVTTGTGRYWLGALPPGRYDVTFSRPGLQTLTRRVLVELGRVARADAAIEPSDDEESITSTAIPITVAETTAATSHFTDEMLDRLPRARTLENALFLAPGEFSPGGVLNGAPSLGAYVFRNESLDELTVLTAALPADVDTYAAPVYLARTRSGGEEFSFSLRDTLTNPAWHNLGSPIPEPYPDGLQQLVEATAGGPIVPEKLWFFAGVWHGAEIFSSNRQGFDAKLTWQAAPRHNLAAFYTDGEADHITFQPEASVASLQYTGMHTPRLTSEVVLSRSSAAISTLNEPATRFDYGYDSLFVKTSYVLGDHVLSAGGRAAQDDFGDATSFFVNDRFRISRLAVNAGARHEHGRLSPRVAASFDVRGNGRQAVTASVGDYTSGGRFMREVTAGFATAIGQTGSLRVDALRRDFGAAHTNGVQADFRYMLFDRFHTGGSYTFLDLDAPPMFSLFAEHSAHAWAGVDLPVGDDHEFGITAMQHYQRLNQDTVEAFHPTDLALRYSLPVQRVHLTVAADVTNVFDQTDDSFVAGRAYRGWVRLRH